jgi:hypothetical protein
MNIEFKAQEGEKTKCICGHEGVTFRRNVKRDNPIVTDDFQGDGTVGDGHQLLCTKCGEWLAWPLTANDNNNTWKIRISKDRWIV